MKENRQFAIQALVFTLVCNGVLVAATLLLADGALGNRAAIVVVVALLATLLLWFVLQWRARKLFAQTSAAERQAAAPAATPAAPPARPAPAPDASALHLLSILQRKGRLIDFLQEDLSGFEDAQIGAAVRSVHEGCKQALDEYVVLKPVYAESEGSTVTVQPGFDAHAVRLTGNVTGDPPFKGALRHRGWRVEQVTLPTRTAPEAERVVAPAEVEVS